MSFRRGVIFVLGLAWLLTIIACVGAARELYKVTDKYYLMMSDNHDYILMQRVSSTGGGVGSVNGHITDLGFDARHILVRRDLAMLIDESSGRTYKLTGKIEYWIVDLAKENEHGPFRIKQFDIEREKLGVNRSLKLYPSDSSAARIRQ
jgi:hypothetical protein